MKYQLEGCLLVLFVNKLGRQAAIHQITLARQIPLTVTEGHVSIILAVAQALSWHEHSISKPLWSQLHHNLWRGTSSTMTLLGPVTTGVAHGSMSTAFATHFKYQHKTLHALPRSSAEPGPTGRLFCCGRYPTFRSTLTVHLTKLNIKLCSRRHITNVPCSGAETVTLNV